MIHELIPQLVTEQLLGARHGIELGSTNEGGRQNCLLLAHLHPTAARFLSAEEGNQAGRKQVVWEQTAVLCSVGETVPVIGVLLPETGIETGQAWKIQAVARGPECKSVVCETEMWPQGSEGDWRSQYWEVLPQALGGTAEF